MDKFIAACVSLLAIIGALFGVHKSGENKGKKEVEAELNEELIEDMKNAKEISDEVDALSDDDLINRVLNKSDEK